MTSQYSKDPKGLPLFTNLDAASSRLEAMTSSFTHLVEFREMLNTIAKDGNCRKLYPNLRRHVADAAFDAERHSRLASKLGLDAMNELRDSGTLQQSLRRAIAEIEKSKDPSALIPDNINRAKEFFAKHYKQLDTAFFDEALSHYRQLEIQLGSHKNKIAVEAKLGDGRPVIFRIDPAGNPGASGRISSSEFFGGLSAPEVLKTIGPVWTQEDCHHRDQWDPQIFEGGDLDLYGGYVGGLKSSNELLYNYARRVDEVGTPYLNGRDPLTAILVGLAIVAAVLIISGVVIEIGCATGAWSGDVCNYGIWLILFGVIIGGGVLCVALGACQLVLAIIAVAV
jgi:hypothetical protein